MQWQDIVFAGGTIIMTAALVPSVVSDHKPALSTSIITSVLVFVFAITYLTLNLVFAAITTFAASILWGTLAIQKYRQTKKPS